MSARAIRVWALLFAGSVLMLTADYVSAGGISHALGAGWRPYVAYLEAGE